MDSTMGDKMEWNCSDNGVKKCVLDTFNLKRGFETQMQYLIWVWYYIP